MTTVPDIKICIIGLGYVGLPLACMFATRYKVVGFDHDIRRIEEINEGFDRTHEISYQDLHLSLKSGLTCTTNPAAIADCNFFIIAAPTPVDENKNPDLTPLIKMSETIADAISPGAIIVYESTVSPGTTEKECIPVLERVSGLKYNRDFFVGYSPERINPGDRIHNVRNIRKIVSGSTPEAAEKINSVYGSVLHCGTYLAPNIRVAEAAKIIENTQRDVNIAFINEITKILNAMNIDTDEVLKAASTKWNFIPYRPGLVGGHCIGVDPYYLIKKANEFGISPDVISAARNTNEMMSDYLSNRTVEALIEKGIDPSGANILMLGFAFKPDCPDTRNTKSYDVYRSLRAITPTVTIYDPVVNPLEVMRGFNGLTILSDIESITARAPFDAVVHCTPHSSFANLPMKDLVHADTADVSLICPDLIVSSSFAGQSD